MGPLGVEPSTPWSSAMCSPAELGSQNKRNIYLLNVVDKNFYKQSFFSFSMTEKKGEGLGISGFTLGIMGIIFAGWIGLIIAIIGFIFCAIQQKQNKTGLAKTGIILNIVGFVISVAFLIIITYYPQFFILD